MPTRITSNADTFYAVKLTPEFKNQNNYPYAAILNIVMRNRYSDKKNYRHQGKCKIYALLIVFTKTTNSQLFLRQFSSFFNIPSRLKFQAVDKGGEVKG